jgi:hypothetical protein
LLEYDIRVILVGHLPNRNKISIPDPSDEDQTKEESVFLETTQSAEIDGPSSEPYTSQPELNEVPFSSRLVCFFYVQTF